MVTLKKPSYVVHEDRRWRVIGADLEEGREMYHLELRTPGGKVFRVWAWADDTSPWVRPQGHRVVRGTKAHRGGVVRMDVNQDDRGEVSIKLGQVGRRKVFLTTIEGLFDMAARAEANRLALERAWKRRTKRRGRS